MADLLQPDPRTLVVSRHPRLDGDVVSMQFDDGATGKRYVLTLDTTTTDYLSSLFATACHSSAIGAQADQIRAAQRDAQ